MKRRHFIKGLCGLGAFGLLPGFGSSFALAEEQAPKGFCFSVIVMAGLRVLEDASKQQPPADVQRWALGDFEEAQWSEILRPLYRHQERLSVIDGLSLASAERSGWESS